MRAFTILAVAGPALTAAMPAITSETALPTTLCTVTAEPTASTPADCNLKYCEDGTSYCHYWAGITGWDSNFNPIPGMCAPASALALRLLPTKNRPDFGY
jgi:hypothetical protein